MLLVRLAVFAAVFFTSFSAILVRLSDSPPLVIAAWRMALAALIMAPMFALRVQRSTRQRPPPRTLLLLVAAGVLLALHFGSWFASLGMTSVAHATVLVTIHPVPVMLFSALLLGERLRWRKIVAAATAIAGAVILALENTGGTTALSGDLLAVLGAFAVGGYLLIGRYLRRSVDTVVYTTVVYAGAAVVLFIAAAITGDALLPGSGREVGIFLLLAVVCTLLGHSVFNWALKYVSATEVSLAVLLEPVAASVMAYLLFQEVPGVLTVTGSAVIFTSLILLLRREPAPL